MIGVSSMANLKNPLSISIRVRCTRGFSTPRRTPRPLLSVIFFVPNAKGRRATLPVRYYEIPRLLLRAVGIAFPLSEIMPSSRFVLCPLL